MREESPQEAAKRQSHGLTAAATVEHVNHPDHYGGDTLYETIKVLEAWMTPEQFSGFCRGNSIKYLSRAGKKGDILIDLKKAQFYLNREIEAASKAHG